jgi:hypothetical protein
MRYFEKISMMLVGCAIAPCAKAAPAPPQSCSWSSLTHACCSQQSASLPALTWSVSSDNPDCRDLPGHASCLPQLLCVIITKPASNIQTTVTSTPANIQGSWELFYRVGEQYDHGSTISVCTAYKWWSQTERTATIHACYDHQ